MRYHEITVKETTVHNLVKKRTALRYVNAEDLSDTIEAAYLANEDSGRNITSIICHYVN